MCGDVPIRLFIFMIRPIRRVRFIPTCCLSLELDQQREPVCTRIFLFLFSRLKQYGEPVYISIIFILGLDQYGEPVHASMYYDLWINNPHCSLEYPDYTYEEHFGKALPAYVPRSVVRNYLEGEDYPVVLSG